MKRKKMFALVEAWRESGQSIKAFLVAKDLKPATFSYWRQKYRQENSPFTELKPQSPGGSYPVELFGPFHWNVRFSDEQVMAARYEVALIPLNHAN